MRTLYTNSDYLLSSKFYRFIRRSNFTDYIREHDNLQLLLPIILDSRINNIENDDDDDDDDATIVSFLIKKTLRNVKLKTITFYRFFDRL